jgi:hypothetical protein
LAVLVIIVFRFWLSPSTLPTPTNGLHLAVSLGFLTRIPDAIVTVREERRRTEAKRKGTTEIAAEVRQLNATDSPGSAVIPVGDRPLTGSSSTLDDTTVIVRALYSKAMMAVDHYEVEYDEPLLAHVAAEHGTDFGTGSSTTDHAPIPLQRALVRTNRGPRAERFRIVDFIRT